jgi:predicted heme/steroid binding protein
MLTPIQVEYNLQSAEYYFATLMDQLVEETMQLEPVDSAFVQKVDELFYTIEAVRFFVDRGIFTDNADCLAVYNLMMTQIGINTTLPDLSTDSSLVIPGTNFTIPYIGPQGPQGVAGPQGTQGVSGPQGVQGPQGFQGANGTSVVIKGVVQSVANLPPTGNTPGDLYIVLDDGDGYVWDGSQWDNVGQIQGPQGSQGPQGPQGTQGFQGPQGAGPQGFQGPQGPSGAGSGISGATNTVAKFTSTTTIGNSNIIDTGSLVQVSTNIQSTGFVKTGGNAFQFLKADGTVDSNTYSTVTSGLANYIPMFLNSTTIQSSIMRQISGTIYVDGNSASGYGLDVTNVLGGDGIGVSVANTGIQSFGGTTGVSGASTSGDGIWGTSTSGIAIYGSSGSGVGLKISSGNAVIAEFYNGISVNSVARIVQAGQIYASGFIKTGGTASQFLKADGSVDSTSYVTYGRTLTINGTTYDLSENRTWNVGNITGTGSASFVPVFNSANTIGSSFAIQIRPDDIEGVGYMVGIGGDPFNAPVPRKLYVSGDSFFNGSIYTNNSINTTAGIGADLFVKNGGTANQFLKANGSVDSTTYVASTRTLTINGVAYDLSTNRTWSVGTVTSVTGAGTVSGLTLSGTVTSTGSITLGGSLTLTSGQITSGLGYTPVPNSRSITFNGNVYYLFSDIVISALDGTGTIGFVPRFDAAKYVINSQIFDNGICVGIDQTNPQHKLDVNGGINYQNQFNRRTANYTLVFADSSKIIETNIGVANTVTVPPNSSVPFPIGTEIAIIQYGAGQTTIVAGGGVTLKSKQNALKLSTQYAGCTVVKMATDEWYVIGDLVI